MALNTMYNINVSLKSTYCINYYPFIKEYKYYRLELNQAPVFVLSPHLSSPDAELHYLRQISELIIMFLMPRCYSFSPASHLMREILACKGMFNTSFFTLLLIMDIARIILQQLEILYTTQVQI